MAILRHLYIFLLLFFLNISLTSCYQTFEPDLNSDPVLCMNSEIMPGKPITLFLTRTWNWTEGSYHNMDVNVRDAEVRLIVNGDYKETLTPEEIDNGYNPASPYPQIRPCYQSSYCPEPGDIIRLEATSQKYGKAWAEVTVPETVEIQRLELRNVDVFCLGNQEGFPAIKEECEYLISFNTLVHFTDPSDAGNYYDVKVGTSSYMTNDWSHEVAYAQSVIPDFNNEPLFTEHVSVLESAIADTSGYTIFSDRQINGKTYPLKIGFRDCEFYYLNPDDNEAPKEYGIVITLRHINSAYYKHVISLWESNDALVGALGGIGLANPVYPYSNVSTGAGVVAAYAISQVTIPFVELISMANSE
ncbi:MAG: DUF4249 domain-containing protein [Muribaculaceae bacterium]|nr:DUF4249 domain-containing protein [Muribaculaceae bacterium]